MNDEGAGIRADRAGALDVHGCNRLNINQHFARLLKVTQRRWTMYLDKRLAGLGLTSSRWNTLVEISRAERSLNQRELAEKLGIEGATLVHLLDGLASQDLIVRVPDENDRRSKRIEMTPVGKGVIREIAAAASDVRAEVLEGVTDSELKLVVDVLEKVNHRLDELAAKSKTAAANSRSENGAPKEEPAVAKTRRRRQAASRT